MRKKMGRFLITRIMGLLFVALLVDLCAPFGIHAQTGSTQPVLRREKMAVMPFFKGRYGADLAGVLTCPLCQLSSDRDSLMPQCDKTLTVYVQEALERRHEDITVPLHQVLAVYGQIPVDETKDTPIMIAQELGKRLGADYIFVGTVWRYVERKGSPLAIESAASVGFALYLIDVGKGAMVWNGMFAETQRSLSENILQAKEFFEKGVKWLTADELALYGVKEIFKGLPY